MRALPLHLRQPCQAVDSSPFYLFDEIDAALDPQYRQSVARFLQEQSQKTQFICSTFKPELAQVAESFYGLEYRNKMTCAVPLTRQHALRVIQDQPATASRGAGGRASKSPEADRRGAPGAGQRGRGSALASS